MFVFIFRGKQGFPGIERETLFISPESSSVRSIHEFALRNISWAKWEGKKQTVNQLKVFRNREGFAISSVNFFYAYALFLSKLFFFMKEFTMCSSRKNLFYLTSEILERDYLISWRHVDSTESQKRFEPLRTPIMILLWMAPRTRLSL